MKRSILKIVIFSFILIFSLHINSFANNITISTETTKHTYSLNENFYVTVNWVENMQASGFVLNYDATKIELVDAFLEEDFYNTDKRGKLVVNWASMDEVDFTNLPFLFKAIGVGDAEISIAEVMGFADENLVVPDNIDYKTKGTKTITIVENNYLLNNNLDVRYVKELLPNEISNSESISGFSLINNKLLKNDVLSSFNTTDYSVRIFSNSRVELEGNDLVGTGAHIEVYTLPHTFEPIGSMAGELVNFYTTVIYGDTTGDGQINAIDALALIKDINNKIPFTSKEYREAGRIICSRTEDPTAVDALAIIKHANGKYTINQTKDKSIFAYGTNFKFISLDDSNEVKSKSFCEIDLTESGANGMKFDQEHSLDISYNTNTIELKISGPEDSVWTGKGKSWTLKGKKAIIKTSQLDMDGDDKADRFVARIIEDDGTCYYYILTRVGGYVYEKHSERISDKLLYISTNNDVGWLLLENKLSIFEELIPVGTFWYGGSGNVFENIKAGQQFTVNGELRDVEARFVEGATLETEDYESLDFNVIGDNTVVTVVDVGMECLLIELSDGTQGLVYAASK